MLFGQPVVVTFFQLLILFSQSEIFLLFITAGERSLADSSETVSNVSVAPDIKCETLSTASVPLLHAVGRPTSLPSSLSSTATRTTVATTTSTPAGMNLLTVGLDSLADGHTGLTPLTGIPSGPLIVVGMPMVTSSAGSSNNNSTVGFL